MTLLIYVKDSLDMVIIFLIPVYIIPSSLPDHNRFNKTVYKWKHLNVAINKGSSCHIMW